MIKPDQIIQENCSNRVEYIRLGEVCSIIKGVTPIQKANPGNYPLVVTTAERKSCDTYQFDKSAVCIPLVSSRGHGIASLNHVYFQSGKFALGNILCAVIPNDETQLSANYLYHYLEHKKDCLLVPLMKGGANVSLHINDLERVKVPIPPLLVQTEIVRILDNFTKLSAELTAELTARKKQYEYYQNQLLTFSSDMPKVPLNDVIISLNTGLNPRQFFKLNTDDAKNYYVTIRELHNNCVMVSDKTDRINDEALMLCNNRSNLEEGDVLFSGTGTIGETALITSPPNNWNIKEGVYSIKPNPEFILSKFLMYILHTDFIRNEIFKKVAGGTVKSIPMGELKKINIPVPPLEEQGRIVSILDRFDKLCNDIYEGLPAEIAARQKQYEYYRNKLLTFTEIGVD